MDKELNRALAQAIQGTALAASISIVQNMDGVERVIFTDHDGYPWIVTVEPMSVP